MFLLLQDQAMEEKYWAHSGMIKTAKAIWQDLEVAFHSCRFSCVQTVQACRPAVVRASKYLLLDGRRHGALRGMSVKCKVQDVF